jgi:hypothetical protein
MSFSRTRALVFVLASLGALAARGDETSVERARPIPGGVVDRTGRTAYVAAAGSGGVDALDLATGRRLWRVSEADWPLLATPERIIAARPIPDESHTLEVVSIDPRGFKRFVSNTVVLPDWIPASSGPGRTLALTGRLEGTRFFLDWEARVGSRSGEGTEVIDLENGRVRDADATERPRKPPLPAPLEDVKSLPYVGTLGPDARPFFFERAFTALALEGAHGDALVLRRWALPSGEYQGQTELGRRLDSSLRVSPDRRTLSIVSKSGTELFSLETGERWGEIPVSDGEHATVLGSRALVIVPRPKGARLLVAYDLATRNKLWEHPVR